MSLTYSQTRITLEEYIDQYKDLAIEEMETYRIPASITLAQGILESDCGNSPLAIQANNHFGIKCHKEWNGKTFHQDDDEVNECFRSYPEAEDSYRDHSLFLTSRDRYDLLFNFKTTDYKSWAYGLKQAGYATNPRYPELLIRIIEENGLDEYDRVDGRQSSVVSRQSNVDSNRAVSDSVNSKFQIPNPTYSTPAVFDIAGRSENGRVIFLNNGVKFIFAREGDTYYSLATEFEIYSWQLFKYNDATKSGRVNAGEKVYLGKKKPKSQQAYHIVNQGETLKLVSQEYGIKLKSLCRLNGKVATDKLTVGEKLQLK
jgi:hypothetical protein